MARHDVRRFHRGGLGAWLLAGALLGVPALAAAQVKAPAAAPKGKPAGPAPGKDAKGDRAVRARTTLGELAGVTDQEVRRLGEIDIRTAGELRAAPEPRLVPVVGSARAAELRALVAQHIDGAGPARDATKARGKGKPPRERTAGERPNLRR